MKQVRLHFVDHDKHVVYVIASSWAAAVSSPHWVRKHYGPDYEHMIVSKAHLERMLDNQKT